jgi:hypothetical protein
MLPSSSPSFHRTGTKTFPAPLFGKSADKEREALARQFIELEEHHGITRKSDVSHFTKQLPRLTESLKPLGLQKLGETLEQDFRTLAGDQQLERKYAQARLNTYAHEYTADELQLLCKLYQDPKTAALLQKHEAIDSQISSPELRQGIKKTFTGFLNIVVSRYTNGAQSEKTQDSD